MLKQISPQGQLTVLDMFLEASRLGIYIHYYSSPPLSASEDKCILVKKLGNFEMLKFQNTQKHSIMVILKV